MADRQDERDSPETPPVIQALRDALREMTAQLPPEVPPATVYAVRGSKDQETFEQ